MLSAAKYLATLMPEQMLRCAQHDRRSFRLPVTRSAAVAAFDAALRSA